MESNVMFPSSQSTHPFQSKQTSGPRQPRKAPQQCPPISPYEAANGISPVVWEVLMRPV